MIVDRRTLTSLSPYDEVSSSASERSQPTAGTEHGEQQNIGRARTDSWVSSNSIRQPAVGTQQRGALGQGGIYGEIAVQHVHGRSIPPLSPIVLPSVFTTPLRSPQYSQPSDVSSGPSPDLTTPPKAKSSIRKTYPRATKVP